MSLDKLYSYTHLGVKVNIYYFDTPDKTVNTNTLNTHLSDIDNNTSKYKYQTKFMSNLIIDIWDYRRPDIPVNKDSVKGIGNYAGLTYGWKNLIELNSKYTQDDFNLAQVLSHEMGHYFAYVNKCFDITNKFLNPILEEWNSKRKPHSDVNTPPFELDAEDFRGGLGSRGAKGYCRGNYVQYNKVQGLISMKLIWGFVIKYIEQKKCEGYSLIEYSFQYKSTDSNYFGIKMKFNYGGIPYADQWIWIDNEFIFKWMPINGVWKWVSVYKF